MLVDALVTGPGGDAARAALRDETELIVPAIFAAEVTSAIWRLLMRGEISSGRARAALSAVASVRSRQYPFEPFLGRVWELRDKLTVYDAWYIALAEALDAELLTADGAIAAVTEVRCTVRHVSPG